MIKEKEPLTVNACYDETRSLIQAANKVYIGGRVLNKTAAMKQLVFFNQYLKCTCDYGLINFYLKATLTHTPAKHLKIDFPFFGDIETAIDQAGISRTKKDKSQVIEFLVEYLAERNIHIAVSN